MDASQTLEIKCVLESERDRLAQEIADLERDSSVTLSDLSGENNYRDHMADQGTATFGKELDMTLEGNARELHKAVLKALNRLNEGSYGTCVRCGGPIGYERLLAMPAAELCIQCKEWEESR